VASKSPQLVEPLTIISRSGVITFPDSLYKSLTSMRLNALKVRGKGTMKISLRGVSVLCHSVYQQLFAHFGTVARTPLPIRARKEKEKKKKKNRRRQKIYFSVNFLLLRDDNYVCG
jgi:hypothetical protein